MMQFKAVPRKHGNKLWVTIPKEVIKKNKIKINKKINVIIFKDLIILCQK